MPTTQKQRYGLIILATQIIAMTASSWIVLHYSPLGDIATYTITIAALVAVFETVGRIAGTALDTYATTQQ